METLFKVGNRVFTELAEAEAYEAEIKALEEKANKLKAEEESRLKEIRNAEINLTELYDKFVEDYGYVNINLEVPECVFDNDDEYDDNCYEETDCDGNCRECEYAR